MKYFYLFCFSILSCHLFAQTGPFKNPSFEAPFFPTWKPCELAESTPDVQPGIAQVDVPPFKGSNYMGMVLRGDTCISCNESVYQELLYPLSKDSCYNFNIMLGHDSGGYGNYPDQGILRIWGNNNPLENCGRKELLWTSKKPYSDVWWLFDVYFSPSETYKYITLEIYYANPKNDYTGHILIDYIHNFKAYPKYVGFSLGEDITVCRGEETTLEVKLPPSQAGYPFKWSTGETSTKITIKEPEIYWAELKSTCGVFRDSIEIKHEKCIFIPNAFTPNNDGKNDAFYIKGINKGNW